MMKAILIVITIFFFSAVDAQIDSFSYGPQGLFPLYLVIESPDTKQERLFTQAINWIKETYRNPDEVIKTTIDTQMIRFEAISPSAVCNQNAIGGTVCWDVRYTIELEFKAGRFKMTVLEMQQASVLDLSNNLIGPSDLYKKSGELRKGMESVPKQIAAIVNGIHKGIAEYGSKPRSDW